MKIGFSNYYDVFKGTVEFLVVSGTIHIIDQNMGYLGWTKSKEAAINVCMDNGWRESRKDIVETLDYALENIIDVPTLPISVLTNDKL